MNGACALMARWHLGVFSALKNHFHQEFSLHFWSQTYCGFVGAQSVDIIGGLDRALVDVMLGGFAEQIGDMLISDFAVEATGVAGFSFDAHCADALNAFCQGYSHLMFRFGFLAYRFYIFFALFESTGFS